MEEYIFLALKLAFTFGILYMAYHILPKNGNKILFNDESPKWDEISDNNSKLKIEKRVKNKNKEQIKQKN